MKIKIFPGAEEDIRYWSATDAKITARIDSLLDSIEATPFSGIGKPEPLKHAGAGLWSRRIDREHRIVYKVEGDTIHVISARYHY